MPPDPRFKTGARPSPRHVLARSHPFIPPLGAPNQWAWIAPRLSTWNNSQYGDCVTAEEAFAKCAYPPNIFWPEADVVAWARKHGWLNGAYLEEVLVAMRDQGFTLDGKEYKNGPHFTVDWHDIETLKAAIAIGPIKIAIASSALPSDAGNKQGWFRLGDGRNYNNTDHSVTLAGYGPAEWLYQQLSEPLPSALPAATYGYLLFTWSTVGFVDHAWLLSTCEEAWVRNPTTVGDFPPPPPPPPPPPIGGNQLVITSAMPPGRYPIGAAPAEIERLRLKYRPDMSAVDWAAFIEKLLVFLLALLDQHKE